MFDLARLTCALALSAVALYAQAVPVSTTLETTALVGLADAQTAQLNLLNPGVQPPALGVVCTAAVTFFNAGGSRSEDHYAHRPAR